MKGNTGITIPKGMIVNINVQGIHRDPQYYPNPDKFDPERFMPENRDKLTPYTYLPFGLGPRNCVGMRFAIMEAKCVAVQLIKKFKFVATRNTKTELKFPKFAFLIQPLDVIVGVNKREV